MVRGVDFTGPLLAVRTVNDQAARRAGCAAGTWLETGTGQLWEQLVTPRPMAYVIRGPAADASWMLDAARRYPDAANRGVLFIPEELDMPDTSRHFRIRASQHTPEDHIHVAIWAGTSQKAADRSRPKLGQLVMDVHDWTAFVRLFTWCPTEVVEIDTSGLLIFDGTGSSDADMHLAGFRGYEGCTLGDCRTPGLCSAKGDCLDADDRPPRSSAPLSLAEEVRWEPADDDDPAVTFEMPETLTRVWVAVTGAVTRRPSSTGWALTVLVDDHPVNLLREDWMPGVDPAPVRYGAWLYGTPGQTYRLSTRLDGASWVTGYWVTDHLPRMAVTLSVSDQPPLQPGFPPFPPAER